MQSIISYIESLLYEHDFVIVPAFGGFVSEYQAARITEGGIFYPPQKEIGFNPNLVYNDGLLAHSIMEKEHISFAVANDKIADEVIALKAELNQNRCLEFGTLGSFAAFVDGRVCFTPAVYNDFLCSSFGFSPFYFSAIDSLPDIVERAPEDLTNHVIQFVPKSSRMSDTVKYLVATAAIFLFFVLFPFQIKDVPVDYQAGICSYRFSPVVEKGMSLQTDSVAAVEAVAAPVDSVQNVFKVYLPVSQTPAVAKKETEYHIIIGSFQTEAKAQHFLSELPSNLKSSAIILSENRYRVSASSFDNEKEGEFFLQQFQKNNPRFSKAWLLKN